MRMGFGAKVITAAVIVKAVLMASIVTLVAATTFAQSIVLVLISAAATGVFGIAIVLIQVHSERTIHRRLDILEERQQGIATAVDAPAVAPASPAEAGP